MSSLRFGAIILGAGASSRMGQPKLLLPWGTTSIVGHLLSVWRSVGASRLAVVCAPPPHPLHTELDRLGFSRKDRIINPSPENGMFSSIQIAALWSGWDSSLSHFAFALGDQPQIPATMIKSLLDQASLNPEAICQPSFRGRPKHPVIMPRAALLELANTTQPTFRDFLANTRVPPSLMNVDDHLVTIDMDSPNDYEAAIKRVQPGSPSASEQT